jgi:hypothetical protein
MYKVSIRIKPDGKKDEVSKVFEVGEIESSSYHDQMNEISNYLYDLDIPFDADDGGDMMIDDILMNLAEQEAFEETIREKKKTYIIKGEIL